MKHTQGEWKIDEGDKGVIMAGARDICVLSIETERDWEANARLIANAPDLLKVCKQYLNIYKMNNPDLLSGIYSLINEAVAKVEGGKI